MLEMSEFTAMTIVSLIIICASLLYLCVKWNKIMDMKYKILFSAIIAVGLALFAISIPIDPTFDISRHYDELDIIRNSNVGFFDFVFGKPDIVNSNNRFNFTFNVIRYFVAKTLPNEAMVIISIVLCYGILFSIMLDYFKDKKMKNGMFILVLSFSLSIVPYIHVYSGMRNAMASAVAALALYLYLYKKKNIVIFLVLIIISATIHPVTIIVLLYVILSRIKNVWISLIVACGLPFAIDFFMVWAKDNIPGGFIGSITYKYYNYMYVKQFFPGRSFFIVPIIFGVMIVLFCIIFRKKYENTAEKRIITFILMYTIFGLINFRSYQICVRTLYVTGYLAPIIMGSLITPDNFKDKNNFVPIGIRIGIVVVGIFMAYVNLTWLF